ncbi:pentatricopeptide repeat-containing protein At3g05340 [Rutidosis leptorrhynchoides]|uniref:pentatricopeptide repeat-containing protein At3g05340 n=1 Tax=Rutidosis leptorrhynchoides TaxID=125765 RepID=UPI003A999FA7
MNPTWVFRKLTTYLPSWLSSLTTHHSSSHLILNQQQLCSLLSNSGKQGHFSIGSSIHATLIKNPLFGNLDNPVESRYIIAIWNSLMFLYSKCGHLSDAQKVFDEMSIRDVISWNTIISGFLTKGFIDVGFNYFKTMYGCSGDHRFDRGTITTILSSCDGCEYSKINMMIHTLVIVNGYERETSIANALITAYFGSGCFSSGRRVFEEINDRNVVTWTAMISGLAQNQYCEESLKLFVEMHSGLVSPNALTYLSSLLACSGLQALNEGCQLHGLVLKLGMDLDLHIESALMDMYSKCGSMKEAWQIFESAQVLDEISMTVILTGFAQNGCEEEAIRVFVKMVKEGIEFDPNMVSAILGVFGGDHSLNFGKQIQSLVVKKGFGLNVYVSNGLINMYSKCGELEESIKVFERMCNKNSVSWNSMIAAFARHGNACKAFELYEQMRRDDIKPTDVTFLSLLHACSHVGLVTKGMEFLKSMEKDHGISPRKEHHACIVDMLGRKGLLDEAKSFIEGLPVKPDVQLWQALLGACSFQGNSDIGKYAAAQLSITAPESPVPYILMANIYSSKGKWKERAETIRMMKKVGVAKDTGISWIEMDKCIHSFVVDDRMHPQTEDIFGVLSVLFRHLSDEGYVPDKRFILHYWDDDEGLTDSLQTQDA